MDGIAEMSMAMSMAETMQGVALSSAQEAMDTVEMQGEALIQMMNQANPVSFGHVFDTYA